MRQAGLLLLALLAWAPAPAADVTLAWDHSPSAGVVGYKIYFGLASRTYGPPITISYQTQYTVTGLARGTKYYFAATAYGEGKESDYSNEVSTEIPPTANRCDINADGQVNVADLQLLINSILYGENKESGDLNADSKTDVLDLQVLSNVILDRQLCPER